MSANSRTAEPMILQEQILQRACTDEQFRQRLLQNAPDAMQREYAVRLSEPFPDLLPGRESCFSIRDLFGLSELVVHSVHFPQRRR